jgi:hypothetical protein
MADHTQDIPHQSSKIATELQHERLSATKVRAVEEHLQKIGVEILELKHGLKPNYDSGQNRYCQLTIKLGEDIYLSCVFNTTENPLEEIWAFHNEEPDEYLTMGVEDNLNWCLQMAKKHLMFETLTEQSSPNTN